MLGSLFRNVLAPQPSNGLPRIRYVLVSATRLDEASFWNRSPLAISWQLMFQDRTDAVLQVHFENSKGLSEVYNEHWADCPAGAALVFLHDDVWLCDPDMFTKLDQAFRSFDVVGLVGNVRCLRMQPAWLFTHIDDSGVFQRESPDNLRGQIHHGSPYMRELEEYGETPAAVSVLDGVFIAVSAQAVARNELQFDPLFKFHHYDSDFCRHAMARQYRIGVWPIDLIHQGAGWYGGPAWLESFRAFVGKWG